MPRIFPPIRRPWASTVQYLRPCRSLLRAQCLIPRVKYAGSTARENAHGGPRVNVSTTTAPAIPVLGWPREWRAGAKTARSALSPKIFYGFFCFYGASLLWNFAFTGICFYGFFADANFAFTPLKIEHGATTAETHNGAHVGKSLARNNIRPSVSPNPVSAQLNNRCVGSPR